MPLVLSNKRFAMKKLIVTLVSLALVSLIGCGTADEPGTSDADCCDGGACADAKADSACHVEGECTSLGAGATTACGDYCCGSADGKSAWWVKSKDLCSTAPDTGPADTGPATDTGSDAPACSEKGGKACTVPNSTCGGFVCCGGYWIVGSTCGTTPPVDSGSPPPPVDAGTCGGLANVKVDLTLPTAATHIYVKFAEVACHDYRPEGCGSSDPTTCPPDTVVKWTGGEFREPGVAGCSLYGSGKLTCTLTKPAGQDIRFQVYILRGSTEHYMCAPDGSDYLEPGTMTVTVDGVPVKPVLVTNSSGISKYKNCQVGN